MPQNLAPKVVSWASILEEDTLAQAARTASLPFVTPHLALMPDAHLGLGATVGSVIPTKGAIIPAAVGVDIGCVDGETEYLSRQGWRPISGYAGGEVMQYDPQTGHGQFVEPVFLVKPTETFLRVKTKYGINQMLTPDHRFLGWRVTGRDCRREQVTMLASELAEEHSRLVLGAKIEVETAFVPDLDTSISLSKEEIRVQVMTSADAHLVNSRAVLHLKKERKVSRAQYLLEKAGIEFVLNVNADGTTTIRFTPPVLDKSLSLFWGGSVEQLRVVADEVLFWDGNAKDSVYFTRDKANADLIQYAFTVTGFRSVLRADKRGQATDYRVFAYANTRVGLAGSPKTEIVEEPAEGRLAYCFTVPSGYWVMRRGGNVAMTGNCGMDALRTQFTKEHLSPAILRAIRLGIESRIPLSAGHYNETLDGHAQEAVGHLETLVAERYHGLDIDVVSPNWRLQVGSLGSGNHFIEVSLDEQDRVWLFLHSGSRGVGNRLAQRHIKIARGVMERYYISLPDPDLSYFVLGSQEFDDYSADLKWAQAFAKENRWVMMQRVMEAFSSGVEGYVEVGEYISCHHNYTSWERHFGQNLIVSRKGAIDAHEGVMGLIPGSMGTASYVVRGKGDPASLCSAPHGAGRMFSRRKAKEIFTQDDLNKAMAGIEWSGSSAFLDEHPGAYKDVDVVMADAAPLVEKVHTLRQVLNVKGD